LLVWRDGDTLRMDGDIDQTNADRLTPTMIADLRDGVTEIDMTGIRFFGAAGVRLLLQLRGEAYGRGSVLRIACSPTVRRVLEVCGAVEHPGWTLVGPYESGHADAAAGDS
jgi:anti-anti-sigma factor